MFHPKFTITNQIANALTTIERARGFLEAASLSQDWITKMQSKALILEVHHTTHIENKDIIETMGATSNLEYILKK